MRAFIALSASAVLAGCACGSTPMPTSTTPSPSSASAADDATVYVNANVLTLDEEERRASVVRVEGDRITHVLDADDAALGGRRVDLAGATVVPGLIDAHLHLAGIGRARRTVDLRGTRSEAEVIARIAEVAAQTPEGTWIRGRGWDQNDWEGGALPTHARLSEAVPAHPVWLIRVDGHAAWLNGRAMALGGVDDATQSPEGGEIVRDAAGHPTGVFVDNAMDQVARAMPAITAEELRGDLESALALCVSAGLTGVHDMSVELLELRVLEELEAEGQLPLRVSAYLAGGSPGVNERLATPPDREGLVRVLGVKYFADGALGSRGAALFEDYSDRAGHTGLLVQEEERLADLAREAHDQGHQLAIHAIGDRGNAIALDAIEAAQGDDRSRRHRVEHVQVIREEDIARLVDLGVVASMQPTHATSDMGWAEARLGPARVRGAYAWRTIAEAGALLALGSDAPVEDHRPALGIHAAVTRQDAAGQPEGGWRPEERLSVVEALRGFSRGPALATGDEDLGLIRAGMRADLTVLREDPTAIAAGALRELTVLRTIVGGRTVYARD